MHLTTEKMNEHMVICIQTIMLLQCSSIAILSLRLPTHFLAAVEALQAPSVGSSSSASVGVYVGVPIAIVLVIALVTIAVLLLRWRHSTVPRRTRVASAINRTQMVCSMCSE